MKLREIYIKENHESLDDYVAKNTSENKGEILMREKNVSQWPRKILTFTYSIIFDEMEKFENHPEIHINSKTFDQRVSEFHSESEII